MAKQALEKIKLRNFFKKMEWLLAGIIPLPMARFIGGVRGFFVKRTYYSQNGEDILIKKYFDSLQITCGHYLDIGCFHPNWLSNTKLLHDIGWTGVGIDIDKYKTKLYQLVRRDSVKTCCAAITSTSFQKTSEVFLFKKFYSEIDTLSEEVALSLGRPFVRSNISTLTITEILSNSEKKFDFINIDIEGLDLEVISEIDFSRFRPYVICFECGRDGVFPPTEVANLLEKNGYRHLFSSGPSHAFALAN